MRTKSSRSWKTTMFDAHIMCKKVLDDTILKLVRSAACPKEELLVAAGGASFSNTLRGHARSPRRRCVVERMCRTHGLDAMGVNEFSALTVCSACHAECALQPLQGTANPPRCRTMCQSLVSEEVES